LDLSNKEYQAHVKKQSPPSPIVKDTLLAFLIGGAICTVGQGIMNLALSMGLNEKDAGTVTTIALVFFSALFTGLNLYNKLARYGGAGTLVPVTGFANAVVSPALDYKSEGFITGMAVKMFTIAGPVIVYGVLAGMAYGLILLLFP